MTKFPRRPRGKGYLWQRTIAMNFALSMYQWRGVWGERQTGTLQTGKGYVTNLGHQEDETGFVYMRARYYEPTTGRFVSEDPAHDGVNWYLYADGNPVNKVDVSGKIDYSSWAWMGFVAASASVVFGVMAIESIASMSDFLGMSLSAVSMAFLCIAFYCYAHALGALTSQAESATRDFANVLTGGMVAGVGSQLLESLKGFSRLGKCFGGIALVVACAGTAYSVAVIAALFLIGQD